MANHYMLFSVMGPCNSPKQADWLTRKLQEMEDNNAGPVCQFEREGDNLWLYSEETFNPEALAAAVCEFQGRFRSQAPWSFEWAETCSKPRLDEFGGGACVCYRGKAYWFNTGRWVLQMASRLTRRRLRRHRGCKNQYERL